jgi:hypothetical protein
VWRVLINQTGKYFVAKLPDFAIRTSSRLFGTHNLCQRLSAIAKVSNDQSAIEIYPMKFVWGLVRSGFKKLEPRHF